MREFEGVLAMILIYFFFFTSSTFAENADNLLLSGRDQTNQTTPVPSTCASMSVVLHFINHTRLHCWSPCFSLISWEYFSSLAPCLCHGVYSGDSIACWASVGLLGTISWEAIATIVKRSCGPIVVVLALVVHASGRYHAWNRLLCLMLLLLLIFQSGLKIQKSKQKSTQESLCESFML